MRYLYFISQEESLLEMSVEKMVDIYLTETPDKLQNAKELQNHYQIDRGYSAVSGGGRGGETLAGGAQPGWAGT